MGKVSFGGVLGTFVVVLAICYAVPPPPEGIKPLGDEMIDYINNVIKPSWTAGRHFHPDTDLGYIKKLCGLRKTPKNLRFPVKKHSLEGLIIPKEFDSRTKWPYCPSIREITDQGSCGSCWAISATSTMTDRYCIATKGKQFYFSTENVISCCDENDGCNGGTASFAYDQYVYTGIVSGGPYNSSKGCQPYTFAPCEHRMSGKRPNCTEKLLPTPKCVKKCDSSYKVPYSQDLHFGSRKYYVPPNVTSIQTEILKFGPVTAGIAVYADFPLYKSGIYHHVSGELLGGHGIKIIGWGEEKGVPYWTIANSFNYDWGENGFFRIRRGNNECGIEGEAVAGLAKV